MNDSLRIRVAQARQSLAGMGDLVAALVGDAYATGYADGLARARAEQAPVLHIVGDDTGLTERATVTP